MEEISFTCSGLRVFVCLFICETEKLLFWDMCKKYQVIDYFESIATSIGIMFHIELH